VTESDSRGRFAAFLLGAPPAAFLLVLWSLWLLAAAWDERLPVADGLGWDGSRFAKMVQEGPSTLFDHQINRYYVQRVGPSYAVRAILLVTGTELTDSSVRRGFALLNALLLSAAMFLLMNAGEALGMGSRGRLFLFVGLFANLANGRLPMYYAPLGDSSAFFIGALMAWAFVRRRPAVLGIAFALAIVSWPAAFALLPLLVWPRPAVDVPASPDDSHGLPRWSPPAALGLGVLIFIGLWFGSDMVPILWSPEVTLALGANALHAGAAALAALLVFKSSWNAMTLKPSFPGLAGALGVVAASVLFGRTFESGSLSFSEQIYVREILLFVRSRALTAIAGHAAYYGFLAMASVFLWPRILREARRLGPGALITVAFAGLMSLDAESRRLNASWPLVGLLAAVVLERICRGARETGFFALAALVLSKLWWPLNGPDLFLGRHAPGNYFNTQGPNMSAEAATVHLIFTALVGVTIYLVIRRSDDLPEQVTAL
jgi:hypothetical protein